MSPIPVKEMVKKELASASKYEDLEQLREVHWRNLYKFFCFPERSRLTEYLPVCAFRESQTCVEHGDSLATVQRRQREGIRGERGCSVGENPRPRLFLNQADRAKYLRRKQMKLLSFSRRYVIEYRLCSTSGGIPASGMTTSGLRSAVSGPH